MKSEYYVIPPKCPKCQSTQIDEVSDAHGKAEMCRDCGHVWAKPPTIAFEYKRFGSDFGPAPTPEQERAVADYFRRQAYQLTAAAFLGFSVRRSERETKDAPRWPELLKPGGE